VAELAEAAGRELGLGPAERETLRHAALLHKVGMLGVPAGLPLRPAPLSDEETDVLREHPIIAQRLLGPIPRLGEAASILRHAHERHDGTGYPDGLAGDDIPPAARVLHAAIAYAAMREPRPWREPLTDERARAELRRVSGTQLDPEVVYALLRALAAPGVEDPVPG
jgi:HD-GYP domain-containing protein (c-di-GMP phosphodiesterase class II)